MSDEEIVVENEKTLDEEVVIDEKNFDSYFFDVRMHKPQRGQVMARYCATAEFVEGRLKKDIIDLLWRCDKAEAATRVMRKLGCAQERESIRVVKEIAKDLASGMPPEEVEKKVYKYGVEMFFYTRQEYIPVDDPHWSVIGLKNLDSFLDAAGKKVTMKTKVVETDVHDKEDSINVVENE